MDRLQPKLIKPESTLIEKTALELAAVFYEAGRSSGLKSKHKDARSYAKAYLIKFIPKAVDLLMDILANPATPQAQKDAIYDALMERTNDKDLANTGLPVFENPLAATFIPDTKDTRGGPLVGTSPKKKNKLEDLPLDQMLYQGNKHHG
jgi:hypothetical protein